MCDADRRRRKDAVVCLEGTTRDGFTDVGDCLNVSVVQRPSCYWWMPLFLGGFAGVSTDSYGGDGALACEFVDVLGLEGATVPLA